MTLDEKLRFMLLQEYGLSEAIKEDSISDVNVKIIQKSTDNEIIQNEIDNILQNRTHEKVIEETTKYRKFQYLNGFAAMRARLECKNGLRNLLKSSEYLSEQDKKQIEILFTK